MKKKYIVVVDFINSQGYKGNACIPMETDDNYLVKDNESFNLLTKRIKSDTGYLNVVITNIIKLPI